MIQKFLLNLSVDESTNTFNGGEDAIQFYKNRKLLLLMIQVSISQNRRRVVKIFKILFIINLRRIKFRKVLIEKFLVSFGIIKQIIFYLIIPTLLDYAAY